MQEYKNDILVAEGLQKVFDKKSALSDVSFRVAKGEFLSILGPSGCGKTTLLRILIGLLKPDGGKLYLNGADITNAPPAARHMGIVFQNYALFENMTVLQNVQYALKINKKTKADSKERATEMIKQMGLYEHRNKKPSQLSGGQQQRVAIARTLVLKPDIILFDEPMSALDVATRLSLRKEIKEIQHRYNITMIYITHDQEEAFSMSDRIMVMENNHISQIDTPEEIIENPANDYVKEFVIDNIKAKIDSLIRYVKVTV